ncbi:hypothetical protein FOL47_009382 [Perkinsus chesapeaki]|uniref:Uncharacterized protein n=1 Tax=Perkinsus chesapeaki TaxID=330153 RepID=A0A7J6MT21_PERCH|nr:hypothetical protein FOL47_009382 [Perkinsus chesapeaki]
MPFAIKPWVGLFSDCYPLFGYKRMPYVFGGSIIGLAGTLLAVLIVPSQSTVILGVIGLFMMIFYWIACCDLLSEAVYSRKISSSPANGPALVGYVTAGQKVLGLVAGLLSGVIVQYAPKLGGHTGSQWALATTIVPSIVLIIPVLLNYFGEEKWSSEDSHNERMKLWNEQRELVFLSVLVGAVAVMYAIFSVVVASFEINFVLLFVLLVVLAFAAWLVVRPLISRLLLFKCIAGVSLLQPSGPAQYFFTDDAVQFPGGPNLSPLYYGSVVNTVGIIGGIIGITIFTRFMSSWTYRRAYLVIIITMVILQLGDPIIYSRVNLKIGIPDKVFVVGSTALVQVGQLLIYMPGSLMLSYMCPKNLEGTMFALLAAIHNFAFFGTGSTTAYISESLHVSPRGLSGIDESAQFDNLWIVSLICILVQLIPLGFLWLLPDSPMDELLLPRDQCTSATVGSPYKRFLGNQRKSEGKSESLE